MLVEPVGASLRSAPGWSWHVEEEMGMAGGKARLPPRWFIKSFWHVHRRIVRAGARRKGLWAPRPGKWRIAAHHERPTQRRAPERDSRLLRGRANLVSMAMKTPGEVPANRYLLPRRRSTPGMEGQIAFAVCRGFATAEQALSFALWGLRGGRGLPGAYGIPMGSVSRNSVTKRLPELSDGRVAPISGARWCRLRRGMKPLT